MWRLRRLVTRWVNLVTLRFAGWIPGFGVGRLSNLTEFLRMRV